MTNEKKVAEWIGGCKPMGSGVITSCGFIDFNESWPFTRNKDEINKFITDAINEKIARVKNE